MFVQLEWGRISGIKDIHFPSQYLDFTGRHIGIRGPLGPRTNQTRDLHHPLGPGTISRSKSLLSIGINHNLKKTLTITQIKENYTAMVAATVNPTTNSDRVADVLAIEFAAVVGTHGSGFLFKWPRRPIPFSLRWLFLVPISYLNQNLQASIRSAYLIQRASYRPLNFSFCRSS